jgi:hypothetical protein
MGVYQSVFIAVAVDDELMMRVACELVVFVGGRSAVVIT